MKDIDNLPNWLKESVKHGIISLKEAKDFIDYILKIRQKKKDLTEKGFSDKFRNKFNDNDRGR